MNASVDACGTLTKSKTESASVMLCAIVNAVMVFNKLMEPDTRNKSPNTNSI